jgi:hypothetical protein
MKTTSVYVGPWIPSFLIGTFADQIRTEVQRVALSEAGLSTQRAWRVRRRRGTSGDNYRAIPYIWSAGGDTTCTMLLRTA